MTEKMEAIYHNVRNLLRNFRDGKVSGWRFAHYLEEQAKEAVKEARREHYESLPLCDGCGCRHPSCVMCPPHEAR